MSILIAYKKDDTIYLGTDTRVILSDTKHNRTCECDYKIQKMENGMLVGIVNDVPARQVLFAHPEVFTLDKQGKLSHKHIVLNVIPKIIDLLKYNYLLIENKDDFVSMSTVIMLAHKDVLYRIDTYFGVHRMTQFDVQGAIGPYSIGVVSRINESEDINTQIVQGLDIASKYSIYVSPPYLLVDTKSLKYSLVGGNNR